MADQLTEVRAIVQEWADKQGHNRCWWFPELFQRLAQVLQITPRVEPALPTRSEFEGGCRRYTAEQFPAKPAACPKPWDGLEDQPSPPEMCQCGHSVRDHASDFSGCPCTSPTCPCDSYQPLLI